MYCTECGSQIMYGEHGCKGCYGPEKDGSTYCSECGGRLYRGDRENTCTCEDKK